jgi:hypothetical protein
LGAARFFEGIMEHVLYLIDGVAVPKIVYEGRQI